MAFSIGTCDDYKDALADLRTLALAHGWADGGSDGRYSTGAEDEWIATGSGAGSDVIVCGVRTYSSEYYDYHNWELAGMDTYASGSAFEDQPGISPGRYDDGGADVYGAYVPLCARDMKYWFSATSRRLVGVIRAGNVYSSFYLGWGMPFDTVGNYADPKCVAGTMPEFGRRYSDPDVRISGVANPIGSRFSDTTRFGPMMFHNRAGSWENVANSEISSDGTSVSRNQKTANVLFPTGNVNYTGLATGADSWITTTGPGSAYAFVTGMFVPMSSAEATWPGTFRTVLRRTPNSGSEDAVKRFPLIIHDAAELHMELDGVFWASAASGPNDPELQPEDVISAGGIDYHVFPMGAHAEWWNYLVLEEK